jgi:hypothetical protein
MRRLVFVILVIPLLIEDSYPQELWGTPRNLGAPVNTNRFEIRPVLTPDMQHLFFSRSDTSGRYWIWHASRTSSGWGEPERLPEPVNTSTTPGSPCFAETVNGGIRLYFSSQRPGGLGKADLWYSDFENGTWGSPQNLGAPINSPGNECGITFARKGRMAIIMSDRGRTATMHNLWETHKRGSRWGEPVELAQDVNSFLSEQSPTLTEDGKTLYFFRTGPGTPPPSRIFATYRKNGQWEPTKEVPSPVYDEAHNTEDPWVSPDGRTLYFITIRSDHPDLWMTERKGGTKP